MRLQKKEEVVLISYISDTAVISAIVSRGQTTNTVIQSVKIPFGSAFSSVNEKTIVRYVERSLDKIFENFHTHFFLFKKGIPTIHRTHCVFSSAWYVADTNQVSRRFNPSVIFDNKLISDFLLESKNLFEEKFKNKNTTPISHVIVDAKPVGVYLNGYHVKYPSGKKATSVRMSFYISAVKKSLLHSVESLMYRYAHSHSLTFTTFPSSFFTGIQKLIGESKYDILVHVSGVNTDISFLVDGQLLYTVVLPHGTFRLVELVCSELNVSPEVAESFLVLMKDGEIHPSFTANLEKSVSAAKEEWLSAVKKEITVFLSTVKQYQPNIYTVLDNSIAALYTQNLEKDPSSVFECKEISSSFFEGIVTYKPHCVQDDALNICIISL